MHDKKPEIGMALQRFILEEREKTPHATGSFSIALTAIETATKIISAHIRRAGLSNILGAAGETNVQGEEVQKLDLIANRVMIKQLSASRQFYAIASEELEEIIYPELGKDAKYIIAMDPLDGSSNIDVNISVGTIFSIKKRITGKESDFYSPGKEQTAAGYVLYGSSTILVYTAGDGVNGFTLDPTVGTYLLSHPQMKIKKKGNIYSFNEANFQKWLTKTQDYVKHIKQERTYSARYTGSLVADVHRTLIKGGIFGYPADSKTNVGKLRVLYEIAPMSFIVEQAGGKVLTGRHNALDYTQTKLHERAAFFLGSKDNVNELLAFLKGEKQFVKERE